jgi:four helix bundle protein
VNPLDSDRLSVWYIAILDKMATRFQSVERLNVWQKAMDLVEVSYRISSQLPTDERFGLISQMRRAATSVPANIAEGFGRWNAPDFARFVSIASGSLRELETHFHIAHRLGFIDALTIQKVLRMTEELSKMLYQMRRRVLANIAAAGRKQQVRSNNPAQATES